MKNIIIPTFILLGFFSVSFAQKNEATSHFVVKKSNLKPKIEYLFGKYGIPQSEQICLNQYDYEKVNNVIVLFGDKYDEVIANYNNSILNTTDPEKLLLLEEEKSKIINFLDVEHLFLN